MDNIRVQKLRAVYFTQYMYVHCTVLNIFTLDLKQHVYSACNCTLYSTQNMYIVLIKIYVHAMYTINLHYCTVNRTKYMYIVQYLLGQLELDNTCFISSVSPERRYLIVQYILGQLELDNSGFISSVSPERQYLTVQYILGQLELDNTGFISSVSPERQYLTVQYIL